DQAEIQRLKEERKEDKKEREKNQEEIQRLKEERKEDKKEREKDQAEIQRLKEERKEDKKEREKNQEEIQHLKEERKEDKKEREKDQAEIQRLKKSLALLEKKMNSFVIVDKADTLHVGNKRPLSPDLKTTPDSKRQKINETDETDETTEVLDNQSTDDLQTVPKDTKTATRSPFFSSGKNSGASDETTQSTEAEESPIHKSPKQASGKQRY
ncbi:MAG: hypothetical protein ACX932_01860, partial [Gammaproteobacteria bacterium]